MSPAASLEGRDLGNDFIIRDGWRMYHGHHIPGFPYHPHSGFETITIVNKGVCDHSDSLGASGRFGFGDVQWMTAGRGVQHSEMFPLLNQDRENELELFQIWLNLPRANKFVEPHFKMLWREEIPVMENDGVLTRIISGARGDQPALPPAPDSWAANPDNEVAIWDISMDKGAAAVLPKAAGDTVRTLFYYEGKNIRVGNREIAAGNGIELSAEKKVTVTNGPGISKLLLLQGKPIMEPVAKYGPFVMNTQAEIQQTVQEYRLTQFGGWPWPYPDNVHPRESGRFARYPDGTLVEKPMQGIVKNEG